MSWLWTAIVVSLHYLASIVDKSVEGTFIGVTVNMMRRGINKIVDHFRHMEQNQYMKEKNLQVIKLHLQIG